MPYLLRSLSGYGVAVLAVALALALRLLLSPLFHWEAPFILFFAAVMVSGWFGGLTAGILATVLSTLVCTYFFLPPYNELAIAGAGQAVLLGVFILEGMLISSMTAAHRWAAEAERSQREWLRVTLGSIGDAVIVTDTQGRVTLMNQAAQTLTGWAQSSAAGQPIGRVFQIISEETRREVESPVAKVMREGRVVGLANHTLLLSKDGAEIPIDDSGAPIRDTDGATIGVVLVFRDIAERQRAEREQARLAAQVERQRQRLGTLLAHVPGVVWEAWGQPDAGTQRIDFVSDYVETMLGYSVQEWLATPNFWLTIVHPDDQERAGREAAQIFAGGTGGVSQFRWVRKDGGVLWVESRSVVVRDEAGQPAGMRGVTMDITERRQAEEERMRLLERERDAHAEAEAARQRLAFLAEASALLAGSLDYEATLASVAQLMVPRLADWCTVDVIEEDGSLHRLAVEHVDESKVAQVLELQRRFPSAIDSPWGALQAIRTGRPELIAEVSDAQLDGSTQDGEYVQMLREIGLKSLMIVPLRVRERTLGAITLVAAQSGRRYGPADQELAEDLARRAAVAAENARLYRQAQSAVRARDQFLSIASHELKTPLTSLMGFAELLQRRATRDGALGERDRRSLAVIVDQARRLNRLVVALLDLSRIQSGQLSIERGVVDLRALVLRQVDAVQPTLERHRLALAGAEEPVIVEGDELRLEQVVQNLIQNAIKYSPQGGAIDVRVERRDGQACVEVTDHGIGIPQAALPGLFRRFYRAPNADAQQISGMGIGLFVVKEIVSLHGGTVEVASQEGQGSTFTVYLPLVSAENQEP